MIRSPIAASRSTRYSRSAVPLRSTISPSVATGTVTFYDTWEYKRGLYQSLGGNNSTPATGSTQYLVSEKALQRVQVDLGWKF